MTDFKFWSYKSVKHNGGMYGSKRFFWEREYNDSDEDKLKFEMDYQRFIAGNLIRCYLKNKEVKHGEST